MAQTLCIKCGSDIVLDILWLWVKIRHINEWRLMVLNTICVQLVIMGWLFRRGCIIGSMIVAYWYMLTNFIRSWNNPWIPWAAISSVHNYWRFKIRRYSWERLDLGLNSNSIPCFLTVKKTIVSVSLTVISNVYIRIYLSSTIMLLDRCAFFYYYTLKEALCLCR